MEAVGELFGLAAEVLGVLFDVAKRGLGRKGARPGLNTRYEARVSVYLPRLSPLSGNTMDHVTLGHGDVVRVAAGKRGRAVIVVEAGRLRGDSLVVSATALARHFVRLPASAS